MRKYLSLFVLLFAGLLLSAQSLDLAGAEEELTPEQQEYLEFITNDSIKGQVGTIAFGEGNFSLTVPEGFVYLDPEQSHHLLVDYWDNPEEVAEDVLGTLVSADTDVYYNVDIAYTISYEDVGYVPDDDADSIDYDELLKTIQSAMNENSKKTGRNLELLGWAWEPRYDKATNTLMWAKHLGLGDEEYINFDMRVLGKDGLVTITAVASPEDKETVQAMQDTMVKSVKYDKGYAYSDFNPDRDHVAEWTLGGLIAGKVLAKVGFWGVLAKFSKVILVAILAFFAGIWKWIKSRGRRKEETPATSVDEPEADETSETDPEDLEESEDSK